MNGMGTLSVSIVPEEQESEWFGQWGRVRPALVNALFYARYVRCHQPGPTHYCGFSGSPESLCMDMQRNPAAVHMSDISRARNKLSFP